MNPFRFWILVFLLAFGCRAMQHAEDWMVLIGILLLAGFVALFYDTVKGSK